MIKAFKKQLPAAVLGLTVDGGRLEGVVLRRSNGSLTTQQAFSAPLALNPMTADPELAGREIRNLLEQTGIRERRCVVCLPLNSAMMALTEIPNIQEEDVAGFLELETERAFHNAHDTLLISSLDFKVGAKRYAATIALPRNQVTNLENALRAAQLKPARISLAITCLDRADREEEPGRLSLLLGDSGIDLQVAIGGGIASLRALDGASESDGVISQFSPDQVGREIRITLGQLPAELRERLRELRVFGPSELARRFRDELVSVVKHHGLEIKYIENYQNGVFPKRLPSETRATPALSVAAAYLSGVAAPLDFLPPKVHPWQQWTARFASRKLAWSAAAAGLVLLLGAGAVLAQKWRLATRERQWAAMEPRVRELDDLQQRIKKFRPWFDNSHRALTILKKLTEAFPEEGVVTARTLEIRDLSGVSCSGVARDNQAFLRMMDQLRASPEVAGLKVDQVRGKTPMQFTFNFQWGEKSQ
jgi:hypothetical protein